MIDDIFDEPDDATPLSEEEKQGLIPSYISTRAELNQAEQKNIVKAEIWAFSKKRSPLDVAFLKELHKKKCTGMFGNGPESFVNRNAISA